MNAVPIKITNLHPNTGQIHGVPANPRFIKDESYEKLKQSIIDDPGISKDLNSLLIQDDCTAILPMIKGVRRMIRFKCCKECDLWFRTRLNYSVFCSKKCYADNKRMHVFCKTCGKEIENKHSVKISNRINCSRACAGVDRKGTTLSQEWRTALSEGRKNSEKCKGKNLYNWKGGKATELQRMRMHNMIRHRKLKIRLDNLFTLCLFIAQNKKCFYCECQLDDKKNLEHLTSVKNGGDNQRYNLVWACRSCNSKKRANNLEEWSLKSEAFHLSNKWEQIYSNALVIESRIKQLVDQAKTTK